MIGDANDMLARFKALLPDDWFSEATPILDAVLSGPAESFADLFDFAEFFLLQTRLRTTTGGFIDMAAADFLGATLLRKPGQSDAYFRALVLTSIFRERATRLGVIKVLTDLTGRTPVIHEGYGQDSLFFDVPRSGGYDTGPTYAFPNEPYVAFIDAFRPSPGSIQTGVTDADIYAAVNSTVADGTKAFVRIAN